MIKQMSRYWHWCYRPWPLGLLVGLLSSLLLLAGASQLGSWQARHSSSSV